MPETKKPEENERAEKKKFSRRDFLTISGAAVAAQALVTTTGCSTTTDTAEEFYPESKGYLVYDSKKCIGCTTCMLSCSMVHYGEQSLSLSRIQIIQDSFGKFPDDLQIAPCRQCVTPPCVINCPEGAAYIDTENGNVRRIDEEKCVGCQTCLEMCPQQPHRTIWNHIKGVATKCDLCIDTPYWDEKGGVNGKQACVESCPMKAIKFVQATPDQKETEGYNVNLRNDHWLNLGLVDSATVVPPMMKNRPPMPKFGPPPKPKAKG